MKVYEALAQAFAAEGSDDIFGLMGDGNMYWMSALERHRHVRVFEARHEGASLAMADGWARANGKVGVCAVTCGPGLAQLATSLIVAARASTPIVVFAGDSPTNDPEYVQKMEQQKFIEACEAGFVPLLNAETAYEAVQMAFYRAKLESRPIVFNAPMDIQMYDFPPDEDYRPSSSVMPPARVQPDPARLAAAAELVMNSKKPVIVGGQGAMRAGAREEIRSLGARIGALLATSLLGKGWFAGEEWDGGISGLYGTRAATELFSEADLVMGVGASLNNYTTEHGYVYPEAKYIQIDTKAHARMGGGRTADVYLQADAKAGVAALDQLLASRGYQATGYRTPETRQALQAPIDRATWDIEPGRVDPREAAEVMDEMLPVDIPLIVGGGHFVSFPVMHMTKPGRPNITTIQWGCIGQGVGTAIGAAVAYGGKPTLLVDGDASAMMHIQEMDTAARYKLPLLLVVDNDEALGAEYHKLRAHDLNADLAAIPAPDFATLGRGFGGRGALVRSIPELRTALAEFVRDPMPTIIDLRVSRQVVSQAYRRLHFGQFD